MGVARCEGGERAGGEDGVSAVVGMGARARWDEYGWSII